MHRVAARRVSAALMLSLAGCVPRQAAMHAPGATDAAFTVEIERGRNIMRPLVRRGAGVAVAVGVGGRLVWSEGFGRTARVGGEAVRPDMPFRAYSLLKQVTASLALQMAARREVDLQASVRRALPSLPAHYQPVTLQQLLQHRGGVRHYRDPSEARMAAHCARAADALPLFVGDSLVSVPGARETYSTFGFALASAVLEQNGRMPFDSLLAVRIARPAAMTTLRLDGPQAAGPLRFYDVDDAGNIDAAAAIDNSCKMGGGGFVLSAEDMVRFHLAVLTGVVAPLPLVRQMLGDRTVLEAAGSGPGGEAQAYADLATGISVVIMSNTGGLEQRLALSRAREALVSVFSAERRRR